MKCCNCDLATVHHVVVPSVDGDGQLRHAVRVRHLRKGLEKKESTYFSIDSIRAHIPVFECIPPACTTWGWAMGCHGGSCRWESTGPPPSTSWWASPIWWALRGGAGFGSFSSPGWKYAIQFYSSPVSSKLKVLCFFLLPEWHPERSCSMLSKSLSFGGDLLRP